MKDEIKSQVHSFLSFYMGEEGFAANVEVVLNILEMTHITKIPRCPAYMKGVINLRGEVLPLIDLRIKFGMTATEITTATCILVMDLRIDGKVIKIGAMVDGVREVHEIEEKEILPPPTIGSKFKNEFLIGMYKDGDAFLMILDMEKIFSLDELVMLQDASAINETI
jgi:purine-binding chemotaxis protein CheW